MPKPPCAYDVSTNHSRDRVTVYAGRPSPVVLCGYHASPGWLPAALATTAAPEHPADCALCGAAEPMQHTYQPPEEG